MARPKKNTAQKNNAANSAAVSALKEKLAGKRVAVLHDWLNGMRGGEAVLEAILRLLPQQTTGIFTLVYEPEKVSDYIRSFPVNESFISRLPFGRRKYRSFLPLFPMAVEAMSVRLRDYDLVLSTSHCVVKGAIVPTAVPHLSYVHSPMRYVWDLFEDYFPAARTGRFKSMLLHYFSHHLRLWDAASACRADLLLANSAFIKKRIGRFWGQPAGVVYPPCGPEDEMRRSLKAALPADQRDDFYLLVTAFAPYKKTSLAIEAFLASGRPLVIVGGGQEEKYLKNLAGQASNITFTGHLTHHEVDDFMRRAKAFIYPGIEDFGITMVEAQCHATPVIAFGRGGVLETVVDGKTGILFDEQSASGLIEAVERLDSLTFKKADFEANVLRFSDEEFARNFAAAVLGELERPYV